MLESMTGYGRGDATSDNFRATVEMRSVNNRYCEISLKLPAQLQKIEQVLKDAIQKKTSRGKIGVTVELEYHAEEALPVHIREDELQKRLKTLEKVREIAGITEPVKLEHLLEFKELFEATEIEPELLEEQQKVVEQAVFMALDELLKMRRNEGRNLQKDLEQRMNLLEGYCNDVKINEKDRIREVHQRLSERLGQLLEDSRVEEERIEQEIAIMADRLDISEELVRMSSHISYFRESLQSKDSQGKKLNFILQEMHREVNTIGSKANHAGISRKVVEMKDIIENIREQIQNIA